MAQLHLSGDAPDGASPRPKQGPWDVLALAISTWQHTLRSAFLIGLVAFMGTLILRGITLPDVTGTAESVQTSIASEPATAPFQTIWDWILIFSGFTVSGLTTWAVATLKRRRVRRLSQEAITADGAPGHENSETQGSS